MSDVFFTTSSEETRALARNFASNLQRGDVIALYGDLGTGKTQFVKGICEAFGVQHSATSPTFVLVNCYEGKDSAQMPLMIYHFDLYRLSSPDELYELGYEEFFSGDGICCIEWAEHVESLLPRRRYSVRLAYGNNERERTITIELQEK